MVEVPPYCGHSYTQTRCPLIGVAFVGGKL